MDSEYSLNNKLRKITFSMIEFCKFILYLIAFIVFYYLLYLGYVTIFNAFSRFSEENIINFSEILACITFLISVWFYFFRKRRNIMNEIPCRLFQLKFIWVIILLTLSTSCLTTFVVDSVLPTNYSEDIDQILQIQRELDNFIAILKICIIVPVFEEILFRGLVFGKFNKFMPLGVALVMQGIIFGVLHGFNATYIIYSSISGILYGFLAIYFKSIIPGIIAHMLENIIAMISTHNTEFLEITTDFMLVPLGVVVFCLCLVYLSKNAKHQTINKPL